MVTKLFPDAVTFVVAEIALIETAFAAADEFVEAPTAVSFILISCEAVKAFVETMSELICVLESTSLKPNLAKSSMLPWLLVYPLARVFASILTKVPSLFTNFKYPKYVPDVKPASVGAFPPITMSFPVVLDNVMLLSEFKQQ